jgi:KDO2-lipid IV(A) lauroyltransferase
MQAFVFYLIYPLVYLVASLPFPVLYKVSDVLYHLMRLSGYRKGVILMNLRNSFPDKSEAEIQQLCANYQRYLVDLILETLKTLKTTEQDAREHCVTNTPPWMNELFEKKKSIIVVLGHYGNWEWAGPSFTLNTKHQLVVIYRPLTHPYFNKMMVGMRTKFGTRITPVQQTLRDMIASRNEVTATTFIADQTAFPENAYWMTFLNQDTAVFGGPEKLAKKFDYPVVFLNIRRPRRGFYEVDLELMFEHPRETAENEITDAFMRRLERQIIAEPTLWLWSHRRWKYTKPVGIAQPAA